MELAQPRQINMPSASTLPFPRHKAKATPLLVHVRLPRENSDSNGGEMPLKQDDVRFHWPPRRARSMSSDHEAVREDDGTSDSSNSMATKRIKTSHRKPPKHSYLLVKEEKEALLQELCLLEARAEALRARVGVSSLAVDDTTKERQDENHKMDGARRAQLLALSSVQSIFSGYMREQFSGPLKINVCLGRDMEERRATLMGLRRGRLDLACRYMEYRLHGVDERRPLDERMTWTSADGDYCFSLTDVCHFHGVQSVKQVAEALAFYFSTVEIAISTELGQLTIREDIDSIDNHTANVRLVSRTDHGIVVEVNTISFFEYHEHFDKCGGSEFAIVTGDSVDEDELYPYRPQERVQRHLTIAITLRGYRKPTTKGEDELVVVMSRCMFLTLKRPQFPITPEALEDLRENAKGWDRLMTQSVRDHVHLSNLNHQ